MSLDFIGNKFSIITVTRWLNYYFEKTNKTKALNDILKKYEKYKNKEKYIKKFSDELNNYFDEKTGKIKNYCILHGTSGCGKTYLVKLLAKEYKMDLLHITPLDINSNEDMNNFIKSVNITALFGNKVKLILVDDIKEYISVYRKELYKIGMEGKSNHPIIYTSRNLSKIPYDFMSSGLNDFRKGIKILRPTENDMYEYLKTFDSDLPDDNIRKIAKESKSVRSAVLSLQNSSVNDMINPVQTNYEILNSIKKRDLQEDLDISMIYYTFNSIRGYDRNSLKVMFRFADFDWRINKYKRTLLYSQDPIDKFFVNNMIEPIEEVELKPRYVKPKQDSVVKEKPVKDDGKVVITDTGTIKESKKNISSIDSWM